MPERDVNIVLNELVRRMNEHGRRLRLLENRNSIIETKVGSLEDRFLKINESLKNRFDELNDKLKGFELTFLKLENDINKINKNLDKTARRTELRELENTLSLFNPLKSKFVRKEDVEKMIQERMK